MKIRLAIILCFLIASVTHAQSSDPMGLSDYVILEFGPDRKYHERRMTNHEVDMFRAVGEILPDGSVKYHNKFDDRESGIGNNVEYKPSQPKTSPNSNPVPKHSKYMKAHKDKKAIAHFSPDIHKIQQKQKPSHHAIAKQTNTKHPKHKESKGTIRVRPASMPNNPSHEDIVRMQQHIQHIERTIAKALDLSLSAYAVAELPQATEGRSSVSVGFSNSDGKSGAAVGYSSNFGGKHEYTVKVSLSHAGHTDSVGAGFGWQW